MKKKHLSKKDFLARMEAGRRKAEARRNGHTHKKKRTTAVRKKKSRPTTTRHQQEKPTMAKKKKTTTHKRKSGGGSRKVGRRKRGSSGGGGVVVTRSRGFLNVDLLIFGGIAGAGFVGATIIAPKVGAMAAGFTGGWSATSTGQMVVKTAAGLVTYAGSLMIGRGVAKYGAAAAVGMIGSAAVDLWDMFSAGGFMRGALPAQSGIGTQPALAGYFGPAQFNSGAVRGGNGVFSPYGGMRIAA